LLFYLLILPPHPSTLFPYTTLFRSRPRRGVPHNQPHVSDHVRQQHRRGPEAVVIHRADVTAQAVQEPVQLALGMVEPARAGPARSEEHTSELQSRGHLVCRLLLEKK